MNENTENISRDDTTGRAPGRRRPGRLRCGLSLVCALTAVALLGACSDDDGMAAAACDASVALGAATAEAPREPADVKTFASARLAPLVDTIRRNVDGDALAAATTFRNALDAVAQSGDLAALDAPEVAAARREIGKAVHDGCDARRVAIGAVEYRYTDVPTTLRAGRVSFALHNQGVEEHEMVLLRRADGVQEPLDQLLELPQDQAQEKLAFTGVAFGGPHTVDYVTTDLSAGTYYLVCFIPQGGPDGPPHFMNGMRETIVVS